jgi:hypothetical protein
MALDSPEKDRSEIPRPASEGSPIPNDLAGAAEWPRLLARIVEGLLRAELHQFEDNVMAFLNSAVADAKASLIWVAARVIGGAFLLTALILLLGIFLQWWLVFALIGFLVILAGSRAGSTRYRR